MALKINREDINRWLNHEFVTMNSENIPPSILAKYQKNLPIKTADPNITSLKKFNKIRRLKKLTGIDPVNYICTIFKVHSLKLNINANYAFLYSIDTKYLAKYADATFDPKTTPTLSFYCISPSLVSQDGEYRNRLLRHGQVMLIFKKYATIFEYIEKFLIGKIEKSELILESENFYPQIEQEALAEALDNDIVNLSLTMKYFCIFWLIEVKALSTNLQENHINPKFNQIFFPHLEEDLKEYFALCKKFSTAKMDELVMFCSFPMFQKVDNPNEFILSNHSVGQKLRPLNVGEVQSPLNILYSPWREIYLSSRAADLIANSICPSFAIFVDWFYIKNSKKGLFDNEQQYQRLEFSERALMITRKLRETQRITYTKTEKSNERKFLSPLFEDVYNLIETPIDYTKTNLLMSNVTLGIITENVGRTIYDIPSLNKSKIWTDTIGDMLKDSIVWNKVLWDCLYALLCLNVKLHQTHSDLHINNATINNIDLPEHHVQSDALYHIMGSWFKIPTTGFYACIIDFSRGTIHPKEVEKYVHFNNRNEFEEFVTDQNARMIWKLEQTVPTFMKINREKVISLMNTDFDKFYKIYSAVDSYDISHKMSSYFKDKTSKANLELTQKITKISEYFLVNIMLKAINNPEIQVEWPIFQILKECFTDNIINLTDDTKFDSSISDIWLFDKPMTYSLSTYDKWPPILKQTYGLKKENDITSKYLVKELSYMDEIRLKYEKYRKDQMQMVRFIAQRHHEKFA